MDRRDPACAPGRIAALVKGRDATALEAIARCYLGELLGVGRCACRSAESAEDAVQEALLLAAERLDQFRGEGSVKAWLSRMVVNACRCQQRGRKNDPAWNRQLDEAAVVAAADAGPAERAAAAELAAHLARALASLGSEDRALFVASQLGGRSAADLGRELGISAVAVRARLTRIRRRLRAELAPVWQEWSPAIPSVLR